MVVSIQFSLRLWENDLLATPPPPVVVSTNAKYSSGYLVSCGGLLFNPYSKWFLIQCSFKIDAKYCNILFWLPWLLVWRFLIQSSFKIDAKCSWPPCFLLWWFLIQFLLKWLQSGLLASLPPPVVVSDSIQIQSGWPVTALGTEHMTSLCIEVARSRTAIWRNVLYP